MCIRDRTYHSLYQIAFHNSLAILQDSHLSKDVAQETLFALWRAYETMNGVGIRSPQAWVKTVARRLSLKAQKHKAKELPCADNIRIRTQNQNDHIRVTELLDAISRLPEPHESVIRYLSLIHICVHHFPYLDPVNSRNKLDNQNAARPGITERAVQTALSPFNQSLFNLY